MSRNVLKALSDLAAMHPRVNVTPKTIELYMQNLADYPEPAVLAAIRTAARTLKFWPSVAELTEIMGNLATGNDVAEAAWLEVQKAIRTHGMPRLIWNSELMESVMSPEPTFSTPLIAEAVASVGWKTICLGEPAEVRRDFVFAYRNLQIRDVRRIQRAEFGTGGPSLTPGTSRIAIDREAS